MVLEGGPPSEHSGEWDCISQRFSSEQKKKFSISWTGWFQSWELCFVSQSDFHGIFLSLFFHAWQTAFVPVVWPMTTCPSLHGNCLAIGRPPNVNVTCPWPTNPLMEVLLQNQSHNKEQECSSSFFAWPVPTDYLFTFSFIYSFIFALKNSKGLYQNSSVLLVRNQRALTKRRAKHLNRSQIRS